MTTLINKDVISELNPCKDRFDNYLDHYKDRSFTKAQFMGLKHLSQADKLWVAFRSMPKQNIALAAADIAESVLSIFEAAYPNDLRPRQAIAAARSQDTSASDNASANAADAAYTSAYDSAYASAYAASYAAFAAAYASAYAYANAANASANAATYASDVYVSAEDRLKQQKLIRRIVLKYWKEAL